MKSEIDFLERIKIVAHDETLTDKEKVETIIDLVTDWLGRHPPSIPDINQDLMSYYLMARMLDQQRRGMMN